MDPFITHGTPVMQLELPRVQRRLRGLDGVMLTWQTDLRDSFLEGAVPPGFPNMRIRDVETIEEVEGQVFVHRIECDGLLSGVDKIEEERVTTPETGWDEGTLVTLTTAPDTHVNGQSHPLAGYSGLVAGDLDKQNVNGHVWRVSGRYRGIKVIKPRKRTYGVTTETVKANQEFSITLSGTTYGPFKWHVPKGRMTVTERFLSLDGPPVHLIGQFLTGGDLPDGVPTVPANVADSLAIAAGDARYNLPWGLVITGMNAEELAEGRDEHDITITYTYMRQNEMEGTKT